MSRVCQVTGKSVQFVREACALARLVSPALVVIEDVDLIAEDRGMHPGQHPLLFQLLNEMDGLAEDADVVFVLTTNRADLLEPALAARPGRVDQAVALELPGPDARRRLFDLYRGASLGPGRKSLAYHATLQAEGRTLGEEDVRKFLERAERAIAELGGELRRS